MNAEITDTQESEYRFVIRKEFLEESYTTKQMSDFIDVVFNHPDDAQLLVNFYLENNIFEASTNYRTIAEDIAAILDDCSEYEDLILRTSSR